MAAWEEIQVEVDRSSVAFSNRFQVIRVGASSTYPTVQAERLISYLAV